MKRRCRHWRSVRWSCASSSCQEAQFQCTQAGCSVSTSACRPDSLAASTTVSCRCIRVKSRPECLCCGLTWSKLQGGGALLICTTTTGEEVFCAFGGRKTANGILTTSSVTAISPGPLNGFGTTRSGSRAASGWLVVPTPSRSRAVGGPENFECDLLSRVREAVTSCLPN